MTELQGRCDEMPDGHMIIISPDCTLRYRGNHKSDRQFPGIQLPGQGTHGPQIGTPWQRDEHYGRTDWLCRRWKKNKQIHTCREKTCDKPRDHTPGRCPHTRHHTHTHTQGTENSQKLTHAGTNTRQVYHTDAQPDKATYQHLAGPATARGRTKTTPWFFLLIDRNLRSLRKSKKAIEDCTQCSCHL